MEKRNRKGRKGKNKIAAKKKSRSGGFWTEAIMKKK